MVDIHCHILPIDDGAKDITDAITMAKNAYNDGVTDIVATPHFYTSDYKRISDFLEIRDSKAQYLRDKLKEEDIKINIHNSAEILLTPDIIKLPLERFSIGGRFILTELPHTGYPFWLKDILFEIGLQGFIPILAHPERYDDLLDNKKLLYELADGGLLLQVCVKGISDKANGMYNGRRLFADGLIAVIASDAHSSMSSLPALSNAYNYLAKIYGLDYASKIRENSYRIINGQEPEIMIPTKINFFKRLKIGAR